MMEPSFGLFNYVLGVLGLPPSKWLESSSTAMGRGGAIIGVSTWKEVGFDTLIFMAALQGVPPELYEAADLDNAGKVRNFST
jgi:ABC-type sugar transport system permease subunit